MHSGIASTLGFVSLIGLSACAPNFPETGAISPFDGKWVGTLVPKTGNCFNSELVAEGEVRYGFLIGDITERAASGVRHYQVWGPIGADNRLDGAMGMAGITGGAANIRFSGDRAQGTWRSDVCGGDANLQRVM